MPSPSSPVSPLLGDEDEVSFRINSRRSSNVSHISSVSSLASEKNSSKRESGAKYDSFSPLPSEALDKNLKDMLASFENNFEGNKSVADVSETSKSFASGFVVA